MTRRRAVFGLWTVAGLLLVFVLVGAARGDDKPKRSHRCTHGVSSIGPVEIVNGTMVGVSATPHTEACLQ
jgi:hypothetical protein